MSKNSKVLVCKICTKKFLNIKQLNRHKILCHPETCHFSCDICNKKYISKNTLANHTETYHTNPKSYHCLFKGSNSDLKCPKICRTFYNLQLHLIHMHKLNISNKNKSKWRSLVKVIEDKVEPDSKPAPVSVPVHQDPDEILNILKKDFEPVGENPNFEIIDRKFTADMDFEIGIERISSNFQILNQDQEISDAESESLLANCDNYAIKFEANDAEKTPKSSKISTKSKSKKIIKKVTKIKSRKMPDSPIKSVILHKNSKNDKNIKLVRPKRSCTKIMDTSNYFMSSADTDHTDSDTDDDQNFEIDSNSDTDSNKNFGIDSDSSTDKDQNFEIPVKKIENKPKRKRLKVQKDHKAPYECKKCQRFYSTKKKFRYHNQNVHCENEADKKFECKKCQVKYRFKTLLDKHLNESRAHVKRENVIKISCPKCPGSSFTRKSTFNRHYMAAHEKVKFNCVPCTVSYGRLDVLKHHLKSDTHREMIKLNRVSSKK